MPRLPIVLALVLSTLSGCTSGPRVGVRAPQPAVASAEYPGTPPPEKEEHPVRDWIEEHPVTTGVTAGIVAGGVAAVVVFGVLLAALVGSMH
jgi:hypothetical protein